MCPKAFYVKPNLQQHIKRIHNTDKKTSTVLQMNSEKNIEN